jgi:hypothetical protein
MLDDNVEHHKAIVKALRDWHTSQANPPADIGITKNEANDVWEIEYGRLGGDDEDDEVVGSIRMKRNNFEVTHVTDAEGEFVEFNYNHAWPGDLNVEVVRGALACNTLNTRDNSGSRAIVILLTSEAARSVLVEKFVRAILGEHKSASGYATVKALTKEYGHTQEHIGGQIGAGVAWVPLKLEDHISYNYALKLKKDKVVHLFDEIHGLNEFLNNLD